MREKVTVVAGAQAIPAPPAHRAAGRQDVTPSPASPAALATQAQRLPPALRSATQSMPALRERSTPTLLACRCPLSSVYASQVCVLRGLG